ncbi:MAG: DUF935 domain-containing protein [Pseudomonadota bacterium]
MRPVILDHTGQPMRADLKKLSGEEAAPVTGGAREATFASVVSGLTPQDMASILEGAVTDDPAQFFAFAQEIEERDTHYGAVLATRKRAVTKLDWQVEAVDESPQEKKIAEAVTDALKGRSFRRLRKSMMDALGKGISITEQDWNSDSQPWLPGNWRWRDQRFFDFDTATRTRPMLKGDGGGLVELTPGKYVIHQPELKTGIPVRNGLARAVAWNFIMKSYTLKDWAAFCEIFGMPLRVGRYDRSASEEDKRRLLQAVLSIASDAGAIIPKGMDIEFITATAGRGEAVFGNLADYLDKQTSKIVLGQTMTTDDGASLAQAKVHDEVRDDIRDDDAADAEETIERDVIVPFVTLNFGVREAYPQFKLLIPEPEDIAALSTALSLLLPNGLRVKADQVRDKLGLEHPGEKDEVLGGAPAPSTEPAKAALAKVHGARCSCGQCTKALANDQSSSSDPLGDEIDAMNDLALEGWEEQLEPVVDAIDALAEDCNSFEEFLARLEEVLTGADLSATTNALAGAMAKARIAGLFDDR